MKLEIWKINQNRRHETGAMEDRNQNRRHGR